MYVVDGRHAVARAGRDGTKVLGVRVSEGEMVGKQTALDRVLGMIVGSENKG
jgi:hypothetical protein